MMHQMNQWHIQWTNEASNGPILVLPLVSRSVDHHCFDLYGISMTQWHTHWQTQCHPLSRDDILMSDWSTGNGNGHGPLHQLAWQKINRLTIPTTSVQYFIVTHSEYYINFTYSSFIRGTYEFETRLSLSSLRRPPWHPDVASVSLGLPRTTIESLSYTYIYMYFLIYWEGYRDSLSVVTAGVKSTFSRWPLKGVFWRERLAVSLEWDGWRGCGCGRAMDLFTHAIHSFDRI